MLMFLQIVTPAINEANSVSAHDTHFLAFCLNKLRFTETTQRVSILRGTALLRSCRRVSACAPPPHGCPPRAVLGGLPGPLRTGAQGGAALRAAAGAGGTAGPFPNGRTARLRSRDGR